MTLKFDIAVEFSVVQIYFAVSVVKCQTEVTAIDPCTAIQRIRKYILIDSTRMLQKGPSFQATGSLCDVPALC